MPAAGEVHVYRTRVVSTDVPGLMDHLNGDERARADRLLFRPARDRFVTARAVLRQLLGACLNLPPQDVPIGYGATGKPAIAAAGPPLHFNVSHAGDLVLYALANDRPVGIDIEPVNPRRDFQSIAEHHFMAPERAAFAALPSAQRCVAFYQTWARKEALGKATGEGVWLTIGRYSVPVSPATPALLTLTLPIAVGSATWALRDIAPAPDYVGALAAEGTAWTCRCMALN